MSIKSNKRGNMQAKKRPKVKNRRQVYTQTPNAKMIHDLMMSENVRGNYKDFVVVAGRRLFDWQGSYDMRRESDGVSVGLPCGTALIHKSKLTDIIGEELARHFWRPRVGRVFHGKNARKKS